MSKTMRLAALARFPVHPLRKYRGRPAQVTEPTEIVSFSYDSERRQHMDDRELKYYSAPTLQPAPCLFDGFERQIRRDHTVNEHIDGLLTALMHVPGESGDFVMYRGMLTRIFVTPFSLRDSWSLNATRVGKTVYIEDDVTEQTIEGRQGSSEQHERLMYSGYRFETLCVSSTVPRPEDPAWRQRLAQEQHEAVVNTHSEYCSVFRTRLGRNRIVAGAEVDCIDGAKPAAFPTRLYRELKTVQVLDTARKEDAFARFKLMKFWAQSFIAGIPTVTVGFRDAQGMLQSVEDIATRDMPRRVRGRRGMWEPDVCINFADQVLEFIRAHVVDEGPRVQYRVAYDAQAQEVTVERLGEREPFLTADYMAFIQRETL
ncbi:decapping endonuclease targeting mRNA [Coemansia sp. Benny D115]|nr:decapping endonuclease targeting mRNA [Coemansia sp. Benny D115]